MNRRFFIIASLLLATLSASTIAATHSQQPIKELSANAEYMSLITQNEELRVEEDSISHLISAARSEYSAMRDTATLSSEEIDRFDSYIIDLEQQIFDIRTRRGAITSRINNIEQEWVLAQLTVPVPSIEEVAEADTVLTDIGQNIDVANTATDTLSGSVVEEIPQRITYRNLIDNECFTALSAEDIAELRRSEQNQRDLASLAEQYKELHSKALATARDYRATSDENSANTLYDSFGELSQRMEELSSKIDRLWNHTLDSKYFAYNYILETEHKYDLLDSSSADFTSMQMECSSNDGTYSSDALMHYAIGRSTLLSYERDFAREMGLMEAADSLSAALDNLPHIEYRLEPLELEKRLFLDYSPITIGRTNFYNASNPLPALKVYEKGTIYRILLGKFRSKQPMTLFKGVQPLYIDYDSEEEVYCYYAGGFATRREADEAQQFLLDKGFKAPEVCRWADSEMKNITLLESSDEGDEGDSPIVGQRYVVHIETDTMSDDMRTTIEQTAPKKSISRIGGRFMVGTFTSRADADLLLTVLSEAYPDCTVTISELELN